MKKVQIGSQEVQVGEVDELCRVLADEVESLLVARAEQGKCAVLGLATGSTPLPFYDELIRRHREEGLSFANVISFNLDEYEGLGRDHERSYWCEMWRNLFDHVDVKQENVSVPPSVSDDPDRAAAEYEAAIQAAGGIDWQLLGIGGEGHIGFNEKGSSLNSRTRRVTLARKTIIDAAPSFGGEENVPTHAITMGVASILEAERVVLMARGASKKEIVHRAICGEVGPEVPASFLQNHINVGWFLDGDAAGS
ncbi:MAG: glucosamine-6-phosphate deaminase [Akkermansiaceae bacterium]|jgi:glucosamine-6-phosphate deaminase|nr:glucosamine-6-phosphate deaminase [Akkermansiaceae bacterium]RZN87533.1 MAG: glucosamine-6-phosphate deaminase [Verrucomicrobiaceae bacterium]HAE18798.1 glucosamine-6-phosphate deaminase [Verrucomicrobiales bacterium]HCN80143.1 glucosamine-6-phosphate deaminase [Verrucomicrobiales bacterium]|tara:strand:+ start:7223 stop:7978 length:756 start_codon:yes stop_codon:yes gene_type:complete